MGMTILLLIARFALAAVFAVAGIAKLADPAGSRKSMSDFGVPQTLAPILAWIFPLAELGCAVALLPSSTAWWGAMGIFGLLVLFVLGMCINLIRGRKPDCHCFGQLHSKPIGWGTVVRNIVLAAVALFVASHVNVNDRWSVLVQNNLDTVQWALVGLSFAVVVLGALMLWALLHMLRQNGRLLLRIEALEARGGTSVEAPPPGLPVHTRAPAFELKGLDGGMITLEMLEKRGNPVLLFFSEPGCGACDAALPELAEWQSAYRDRLTIVPISRGDLKTNRAKSNSNRLKNLLLQNDREVAGAYQVNGTPGAVLIDDGLIASPIATGIDEIRALVKRATLPAPVKKGDIVPSFELPDLDGKTLNLGALKSRRTLLVFWNPACGFCQQMLDDLKAWESAPQKDAPRLLVIAAGPAEENRKQGFRSQLLLDPDFSASHIFNSGGTPSAVLLDEEGRVASDVGVGAPDVLAMARAVPTRAPQLA